MLNHSVIFDILNNQNMNIKKGWGSEYQLTSVAVTFSSVMVVGFTIAWREVVAFDLVMPLVIRVSFLLT